MTNVEQLLEQWREELMEMEMSYSKRFFSECVEQLESAIQRDKEQK